MNNDMMSKIYPGIKNVNERITTEAVARANAMLFAANQIAGYMENASRILAKVKNLETV